MSLLSGSGCESECRKHSPTSWRFMDLKLGGFSRFYLSIGLLITALGCKTSHAQDSGSVNAPMPMYCLIANETCYADTTCYPLLSSVPRWCGNYSAGRCSWVKEQHCLSILRTLKNRQPFKDCHCRQEQFDHAGLQRCRQIYRFVQNHPCLERASPSLPNYVDANNQNEIDNESPSEAADADADDQEPVITESPALATIAHDNATVFCDDLYGEQPSCLAARKKCSSQQVCFDYLDQFRLSCKVRNSRCTAQGQELAKCNEAYRELSRHAGSLFACQCDDQSVGGSDDKQQRCEKVLRSFKLNACVQQQVIPKCLPRPAQTSTAATVGSTSTSSSSSSSSSELPLTSATTRRSASVVEQNTAADCYDVVTECYNNDTCRALLGSMVHACRFATMPKVSGFQPVRSSSFTERCDTSGCSAAVHEFYWKVGRKLAHAAAFCTCPAADNSDHANCIKHFEYLRPPCVFAPHPPSNCFELLHGCYSRNSSTCRDTMKIFNVDCRQRSFADRSTNDTCVNGVQKCRQAILRMVPQGLIRDTCICDGMQNSSARDLCLDVRNKLYNNPCVAQALSVQQTARANGRFGFAVRDGVSRPVFSQIPTGFNESSLSADVCERLPRYNRVTSSLYRLYDRYRLGISRDGGCTELVRCENQTARQANDLWCDSEQEDIQSVSRNNRSHVAFLRPLAAVCAGASMMTSFSLYSSLAQYCVCHYNELVCSTVAPDSLRNAFAQDGAMLLHIGYSATEMMLLQSRSGYDIDIDVIIDKLMLLLNNGVDRLCFLQPVWTQLGHILLDVRTSADYEYAPDNDAHCANASKLLAHFINNRHPFITHELELSILRSAAVQNSDDPLFASDVSSFKRYMLRLNEPIADDEDYYSSYLPSSNDHILSARQQPAVRVKDSRSRDEQRVRSAASSSAATVSFVHSFTLILSSLLLLLL